MSVRSAPWLLALVALVILLVVSDFIAWPAVMVWLLVLAVVWILGRLFKTTRSWRIGAALLLLPILFLLAFDGGWWLIPADLAWLAIELADCRQAAG
jgi:hypothetical protein